MSFQKGSRPSSPYSPSSPSSPPSYIPPHRTQLHPRMISLYTSSPSSSSTHTNPNPNKPHTGKCLLFLFAFLFFTAPFLFYLFSTALQIHSSPKFADSRPVSFALAFRAGPDALRLSVYHFLGPGLSLLAAAHSAAAVPGFDAPPDALRGAVAELVRFAKGKVPHREWGNTVVRLAASEELEQLGSEEAEKVLECCRRALKASGFLFKDEWARVVSGEEQGISSWVAVNYALGNLGREPQETTGIVELGGASLQVASTKLNADLAHSLRTIRLSGVTYNLYTWSLPQLASKSSKRNITNACIPRGYEYPQISDASYVKHPIFQPAGNFTTCKSEAFSLLKRTEASKSSKRNITNACIPRGYEYPQISNASYVKHPIFQPAGNFTTCKSEAFSLLKRTEDRCLHPACKITSSFSELLGEQDSKSFLYTSEILRMAPRTSLFQLEEAGRHYCEDHWDALKDQHNQIDYLDLLQYCFSSAYMLALLHDVLGIAMEEKRVGFGNEKINSHVDWTLGSFIIETMGEPLELEHIDTGMIVGNESVTYFSLFAFLFLIILAAFFVMQWRKPQLKTVYDLEKGHYIVTRIRR
ncbi:probable apyrase 6 isoform X2 [Vigna unguiculata]|uniref:probable apyrase 6 isoform X2 n=1 Tax=Vigna unguiculata TaxID=3917 RepID=UPI001016000A|nr:probable apyrase 6 isoform X2 [Vigna unguiculata]